MRRAPRPLFIALILVAAGCTHDDARLPAAVIPELLVVPGPIPWVPFLRDARNQNYVFVTSPRALPRDVRSAAPVMAAAGERFNDECLLIEGLPRFRLVLAALNDRFVILHYEKGGFAPTRHVVLLRRDPSRNRAIELWSNFTACQLETPQEFQAALRSGTLWIEI